MNLYAVGIRARFSDYRSVYVVKAKSKEKALEKGKKYHGESSPYPEHWIVELKDETQCVCSYPIPNSYVG